MRTCGKGWHLSLLQRAGSDLAAESISWNPKVPLKIDEGIF